MSLTVNPKATILTTCQSLDNDQLCDDLKWGALRSQNSDLTVKLGTYIYPVYITEICRFTSSREIWDQDGNYLFHMPDL